MRDGQSTSSATYSPAHEHQPIDLAAAAEGILNNQYLQQRERLLSASAQASRLLLESPDAMKRCPRCCGLLGEAAQVDRTALAFAEIGPNGEKWLKIKAEWISEALARHRDELADLERTAARTSSVRCCRAGKSVCSAPMTAGLRQVSITSDKTRTSAIVPFMVEGKYVGAIGFDDWRAYASSTRPSCRRWRSPPV